MATHVISSSPQGRDEIRRPAVAGRFYPAASDTLETDVKSLLEKAGTGSSANVQAVIVPHAGYVFSGATAAKAFARIAPSANYKRVFLLGPSHQAAFDGASVNISAHRYATPLGEIEVDDETCDRLLQADGVFTCLPEAHLREHCLEVELPFLQTRLETMPPIVPIVIGTHRYGKLERIAEALRPYFTPDNLFVVSSDFSHYPPYEDACRIDKATAEAILSALPEKFLETLADNSRQPVHNLLTSACGQAPITVLLMLMQQTGDLKMEHLAYCNSGDSPYGGRDEVVGYHAFAVTREGKSNTSGQTFSLTEEEKALLLGIARKSIETALEGDDGLPYDSTRLTGTLRMNCGAFVTLRTGSRLRGCIGSLTGRQPLYLTVMSMARAAAFEDPRFSPVTQDEMAGIHIDISVLSPLKLISSIDEFQLGKHGILIVKGPYRGTFLPQVAEETHWTKEEFLGHCARDKAGIGWNGWRDAELYVYEAEVFDECSDQ